METPLGIVLQRMPQQVLAQTPAEDWTGVTSTAERRKRQNRLNKRSQYQKARLQAQRNRTASRVVMQAGLPGSGVVTSSTETAPQTSTDIVLDALLHACEIFESSDIRERIFALAHDAYLHHIMNTPRLSQLPFLITLNINIAMAKNAIQMGFKPEILCLEQSISPFNLLGPSQYAPTYPENLEPTSVQHQIIHHPWLDVFPFPRFRDNVIQAVTANLMDDDELCADVAEMNYEGTSRPSLIVWGDPGDPTGWEASISFLRKWGWLLQGCPEVLEATNRWRECRGEKRLDWHNSQM
ncbi:hypothetical protein BHE90_016917 [Fusarium euwallaceae]|uniref:BZIP domain-containing protein n=1 Tax=Fusarium euwallaceae TaxID=1147111 RepID=A0A430KZ14_9HYPO|nr:hypothetical protein BHE90_016917 [Fusarium euwallaceae]